MHKLGVKRGLATCGNINRILEMAEGGAGDNAIVGHFKDQGINISNHFVKIVRKEIEEFSKKAVSKSSTKKAIQAIEADAINQSDQGLVPA